MLNLRQYPTRNVFHRLQYRLQRKIFIPDGYIVPVMQHGRIVRLLGPGYHTFWGLNEELCEPINIVVQAAHIKEHTVQTSDRVQILMDVLLRYQFDPTGCASESLSWMITQSPSQIRKMMRIRLEEAVQAVCGGYSADQLASANNWTRLNREIQRHLMQRIRHLGISLDHIDPVAIKSLQVPNRMATLFEDDMSVKHLNEWTETDLRKWSKRELIHNDSVHVVYAEPDTYPPNIIVDMPYVRNNQSQHPNGKHV